MAPLGIPNANVKTSSTALTLTVASSPSGRVVVVGVPAVTGGPVNPFGIPRFKLYVFTPPEVKLALAEPYV